MKILNLSNKPRPFEIRAKTATKAEIIIYDVIGYDFWTGGGVTSKSFKEELNKIDSKVTSLDVRINSPGGDVFEGIAIYNLLKSFKGTKTVYVDGLAASMASVVMLAGDEIIIGEGAMVMIHLPWTMTWGNRMDLENTVQRLVDIEEQMIGIYQKRTGLSRSDLRAMCEKETWMDADEAIEYGFAQTKMEETMPIAAKVMDSRWFSKKTPTKFVSEADALRTQAKELKEKIDARLARK